MINGSEAELGSLASAAMHARKYARAADIFESIVRKQASVAAWCGLASARIELGDFAGSRAAALCALQLDPESILARVAHAKTHVAQGAYDVALDAFMDAAERKRARQAGGPSTFRVPAHFALHNLEQWDHLLATGMCSDESALAAVPSSERAALRQRLTQMLATHAGHQAPWVSVRGKHARGLADLPYIRAALPPPAQQLNAKLDLGALDHRLVRAEPCVEVVDDLLQPAALSALRQFCLQSTIWRRPYKFGYTAAFPEDGFIHPIIFGIAAELLQGLPKTLHDHRLTQWWCFVYDARLPGTAIHADDSDISLNLWITPDQAALDPDFGGLVVWNQAAPGDWTFDEMNAGGDKITAYLAAHSAESRVIGYRDNRAVIFSGRLFHESGRPNFADGFENRRRNLTLLFRKR